jgi:hypothetical protein
MKQLVYGIQREDHINQGHRPQGIDGTEVSHLSKDGLAAVFSIVPNEFGVPDVPQLLAYARVVEDLFRAGSVLPMRYGCLLDTTAELDLLLTRNQQSYRLELEKLDGCVEMGIRVLQAEPALPQTTVERRLVWNGEQQTVDARTRMTSPSPANSRPGIAYLTTRKSHFDQEDSRQVSGDQTARSIQAVLAGLFVKAETEHSAARHSWLVSIHFLVHRDFIERFCVAFQEIEDDRRERLLLTGPWPPYNFVT